MKKEGASGSFRLKSNSASLSRAVSWINFSSLSRQTKRLFRSDGELSVCGQQVEVDDENWTYRTQPRKAVSNLDEESRWTVHYTAPWHQQENVFLPTTRPACVEDLHRQAKLNLKSVLRECDKLRRDGYRSSQYYSQGPTFAANSSSLCDEDYQDEDDETDQKCSISSSEEERLISTRRPKTPTSSDFSDINIHTNWTKSLPLPTPEEKMRQQAQTVQADVVPINITASGTGQDDIGSHSMYYPDHYSTLGRLESYPCTGQRSETRDSSCQTEEVKVVPPSMRRIRAQKGQGIAAQMSHFSGSSGNMSVLSDSAGIVLPSRLNNEAGFHSLPRSGARAHIQSHEPCLGVLGPTEDIGDSFPYRRSNSQVDENLGSLGGASKTGALLRPKSQELRHFECENLTSPACVVSPHATYSTSIIPNATLSSSSEVIVIHAAQSLGHLDSKITSTASYTKLKSRDHLLSKHANKDDHRSLCGNWNQDHTTTLSQALAPHSPSAAPQLSLSDSTGSLSTPENGENRSQTIVYKCRNNLNLPAHPQDVDGKNEASYFGGRVHGEAESWEYSASANGQASPLKSHLATSGYSTPVSNVNSCNSDQASNRDDARSLYSDDQDGYYTPMHVDSRQGSGNLCNSNNGFGNPRHSVINVFDGRTQKNQGNWPSCHDKSLSRNISLKKAKKPPLPPSRTDSLRRVPKKNIQSNGQVLNETLIASLQQSLQLNLLGKGSSSPSQSPCSDFEEPWLPRSRSQSTVSAGSSMTSATTPNVYSLCGLTPAQSDTSSVKSEYTDPWGYYIDYTGVQEDSGNPSGGCPASSGAPTRNGSVRHIQEGSKAELPQGSGGPVKPKIISPEKSHRVTSPSSGYSSQSNTPTAVTPVPLFLKSVSPANGKGKTKPKVPERKSSLVSSVSISSSSTSLSSNTSTEGSGTVKKLDSVLTSHSSLQSPGHADKSLLSLAPPLADPCEGSPLPHSPLFPPPPPEVLTPLCSPTEACFPPPTNTLSPLLLESTPVPSPPPSLPFTAPPPAPPLDPKLMKDTRPSFKKSGHPQSSQEALTKQSSHKEEGSKPPMPLITTQALQTVQLRPVKKTSGTEAVLLHEQISQEKRTPILPQYHLKPSAFLKSRNSINEMESESQPASLTSSFPTPAKSPSQGHQDSAVERGLQHRSLGSTGEPEAAGPGPRTAQLQESPDPSPSRKPPPISKKPKLFLVVPHPQRDPTVEPTGNVSETAPSPMRGEAESGAATAGSDEPVSISLVQEGGAAGSASLARVEANVRMVQPDAPATPKQEPGSEKHSDGGGDVENCECLQDGGPEVLETNTADSSFEACDFLKEEGSDKVMTPSRPRTTEDLFAAIHRSKRKVLGRKDSDDDHTRNHSPSPPVTPTGAAPSLTSPKQVGSIQRSVRKSSTSSDNFKALLLKKGSRSDTGARMSAAEMLKNSDPRFQRSRSEPSPDTPESPSNCSPNKSRKAQEEWAKNEGLMPRSLSFSGPRYGRSRTPPSAASSRYSMRNRIQSSPMTVISEGEGEAVEPVDNRPALALVAAKGCSLAGAAALVAAKGCSLADSGGDQMNEGSLLCGGEPTASLQSQLPGSTDVMAGAEGRDPSEQIRGPLREES
ncbi:NHS-like protein 1 isoform X2 [Erinaceus europaeus]|uniref:NHS-like protein 1 isoform X2 n=1 Tax=Erinaceus europaeus TaxID=9365 RepID=A0A1S3WMM2_ERIEU|nr:NHS-like protein 1 isoform X2 [Erinaceus europaeus]